MLENSFKINGLTDVQVLESRREHGQNILAFKKDNEFLSALLRIVKEPMMILLFVAAAIYFISGKTGDGIFLSCAIIFQTSISLYQYSRSKHALEKLKDFSKPKCKVIRNGNTLFIGNAEVVVGDVLVTEEGTAITADGKILKSNDFSVNESVLTGESVPVSKDKDTVDNMVYLGTNVSGGLAFATVTAIGNQTRLGNIGKSLEEIDEEKTPLEIQIGHFVKKMAIAGMLVFVVVWMINFFHSGNILSSLLQSLTLAMSILPEEIPVAFTTFMALGAWRLMKMGIVVKQMKTVETLGSATVICTDKTGTITENKMTLSKLFSLRSHKLTSLDTKLSSDEKELIRLSMWASEPIAFDPMEKDIHRQYGLQFPKDERPDFQLFHEYPLSGKPPMMTHLFKNAAGKRIIAAKGAPEALIAICKLSLSEKSEIENAIETLSTDGFRILAVASCNFEGNDFPKLQQQFKFEFSGLLAFYDPPKKNIKKVLQEFYAAGITVKIITGDNAATTMAIARQIGFMGCGQSITGDELMKLNPQELRHCVLTNNIFTRMYPEAKMKIINALKAAGQIVAMTGDGVNDGPALKAAHIGIAMGVKGTEIAKQAASLILLEDDLSKMVDAIAIGRKIYTNLKKAIQYIISIHIPIILTVFIPLALGWIYPNIFTPLHIIFLEVIMGPTCSIIYENEPMEKNTMTNKPKPLTTTFFNWRELSTSVVQGLVITVAVLAIYQFSIFSGYDEALTRTMTFTVLIVANIFLTLVNRSFYYSLWTTIRYKNDMVAFIVLLTSILVGLLLYIPPLTRFFGFEALNLPQLLVCFGCGFVSVTWYEIVKWVKRRRSTIADFENASPSLQIQGAGNRLQ